MSEVATTFGDRVRAVMAACARLEKKGVNSHFHYAFLEEAAVKAAVSDACRANGLYLSNVDYSAVGECTGRAATLKCTVTIAGDSVSDRVVFSGFGSGTDSSDKAPMKACAAALKYALTSGLLISTGDDPEKDEAKPTAASKAATSPEVKAQLAPKKHTDVEQDAGAALSDIAATCNVTDLEALKPRLEKLHTKFTAAQWAPVIAAYVAQRDKLTKE